VSLAALSHGLKEIATLIPEDRLHSYCTRTAEIARSESQDPALSRSTRALAASYGANLIWRVGRMRDADGATAAVDFYREAIELHEEPPAELLSNAGECFLAVARSPRNSRRPWASGTRAQLHVGATLRASSTRSRWSTSFAAGLAEHRTLLQQDPECSQTLVEMLDIFVRAGWLSAHRLTYGLDEIYR
jgi:hypothetical protein